jgi:dTDP-glucose 4,6-dehydratase
MNELAGQIRDLAGSDSPIVHIPRPTDDPSVRRPDIDRARTELGWTPQVPIEQALATTIDWFRRHPDLAGG